MIEEEAVKAMEGKGAIVATMDATAGYLSNAIGTLPTEQTSMAVALAVVCLSMLYLVATWTRRYLEHVKPFDELPMAKGSHWLFGHIWIFLAPKGNWQEGFNTAGVESANEYGQTGLWMLRFKMVNVNNWKDARTVLNTEHERRPPRLIRRFNAQFIGRRNLLVINGREWKHHRSAVTRTFSPKYLKSARNGMKEITERMVTSLQQKITKESPVSLEMERLMKMITLDVFGRVALSTDFELTKTLKASPLVLAFEYILQGTFDRLRAAYRPKNFFFSIPTQQNLEHKRQRYLIRKFIADLINEKREDLQDEDKDLLAHLVKAHLSASEDTHLNPDDVSDEALTDVLMTLLFAGYDTTSVTLTFALYLLAQHPEVQERCVEEINAAGDVENIEELKYCWAVLWETLRLYPAGVRTNRTLAKPSTLSGGFVAPAGTRINIPIWNIHHDEKVFPRPDEFRPDRWVRRDEVNGTWQERSETEVDAQSTIPAGNLKAMLAFSAGGRNCVGQKFAVQEALIILAGLLKGLKFSAVAGYELKTTISALILKPVGGLPLKVGVREHDMSSN